MELDIFSKKHGQFVCIIDDEDYPLISKYHLTITKRKKNIYVMCACKNEYKLLHRVLLNMKERKQVIDHINGNGLDNRKDNLRICTQGRNVQNQQINARKTDTSSSKYKGVCFDKRRKKWAAYITVNYKHKYLGRFETELEAAYSYNNAAIEYFGEFSKINEV